MTIKKWEIEICHVHTRQKYRKSMELKQKCQQPKAQKKWNITSGPLCKQTNKQNKQAENELLVFSFFMYRLDKLSAVSAETLTTLKYLLKIFFNMDIMDLCLLLCFFILFKSWLASVMKILLSEVVPTNLKISDPIEV